MSHSRSAFVWAGLILAIPLSSANAQSLSPFADSPVYGGYAWSWFGSTSEGDIDRAIGAYLTDAGLYEYYAAWAEAIDSDRIRRENDYLARVVQSQSRIHARRLATERDRIARIRKAIDDRYREAPTVWDVEHGDALNYAFRMLTALPSCLGHGGGAGATIPIAMVRHLPLRYAPGAETIRLDRVKDVSNLPPAVLAYALGARTDPADNYLRGLRNESETTVGQLLEFMQEYHLQFGVAETAMQKTAYRELYQHLARLIRTKRPAKDRAALSSR
jgi:hypothetical protein